MTEKAIIRVVKESADMVNGIIDQQQFHNWLLNKFTVKCQQCKGHGFTVSNEGIKHDCVTCNGLGVLPREKKIDVHTCFMCDSFQKDTHECSMRNNTKILDPQAPECSLGMSNRILSQME